ncbi:MAG: efflux RND transporter periplasmic adaptor subunit [Candidatus Riflebacteria bacterium]|nr:efflux RND transporter periplasmic adaptor subunit [Candidatus Riflebacteria bacterium]
MQKSLSWLELSEFKKPRRSTLLMLLVVAFLSGTLALQAQAPDDAKILPVIVQKAVASDISAQLLTSGEILPFLGADIHPKTGGEIIKVNVSEGSQVAPGDLLAEIDHRILDAQLEQAKAAVTVARSSLDAQAVLVKTSQSALISAKAQASAVKAQVTNLTATRKRYQELFREGAVSEQQLDDVTAQHDAAQAQLVAAESGVRQAEDGIQTNQVNLKMRQAQLLQTEANLHAVEVQRENAFVRAPFAGIITRRMLDQGAMANVGQPIFRLEQMSPVKVIGTLVEKDLMLLTPKKTRAVIKVASVNRDFNGVVDKLYPAIAAKTRTGEFEIILDNPEMVLRSGMYAGIVLELDTAKNAVVINRDALLSHGSDMAVIRVDSNGLAERIPVKVGIIQGTRAQILEGLKAGDMIVGQGGELVKTGSYVKPILTEDAK